MMNTSVAPHSRPFFEVTGLRFRLWPILLAGLLMQGILWPAQQAARWLYHNHPDLLFGQTWAFVGIAMLLQALGGLVGILLMRRLLPAADGYLRWPPSRSYAGLAALIGIGMGLVMLLADYWPEILSRTAPSASYDLNPLGASGWLAMMAATGLAEETVFRGLLVGMLVVLTPGRLRMGNFEVPLAAAIVGLLFAVAHYRTFLVDPLHLAIAQQLYAFFWALVYVWLMERSHSLLAPIIAHGLGNFTEVALVMLMMSAWS